MRARRAPVAVALLAALSLVSACSGSDGVAEPSTTSATTSAGTTTASTSQASSPADVSTLASSTADSAPTASSLVQPTLSTEQVEAYTGAMGAVSAYYETISRAFAAPDQDWSRELAEVAAEPLLSQLQDQLKKNAADGTKITGQFVVDFSVPMAGPINVEVVPGDQSVNHSGVTLAVCIDASAQEFVSSSGEKSPAFGDYSRVPTKIELGEFPNNRWLVGYYELDNTKTC